MKKYKDFKKLNSDSFPQFVELADNRIYLSYSMFRFSRRQIEKYYKLSYKLIWRRDKWAYKFMKRQDKRMYKIQRQQEKAQLKLERLEARKQRKQEFLQRLKAFFHRRSKLRPLNEPKMGQGASQPLAGTGQRPVCSSPLTSADGLKNVLTVSSNVVPPSVI